MKIKKVTLKVYDEANTEWVGIYPRTSGDRVVGQVPDSGKLGGQPPEAYMPAFSDVHPARILMSDGKSPQGLTCGKLVVSKNYVNDEKRVNTGDGYLTGDLYVQSGRKVATLYDVSSMVSQIEATIANTKVSTAEQADRLAKPVKINGQAFDGTNDVNVKLFLKSSTAPTDVNLLWINDDDVLNYYANGKWNPIIGVWG